MAENIKKLDKKIYVYQIETKKLFPNYEEYLKDFLSDNYSHEFEEKLKTIIEQGCELYVIEREKDYYNFDTYLRFRFGKDELHNVGHIFKYTSIEEIEEWIKNSPHNIITRIVDNECCEIFTFVTLLEDYKFELNYYNNKYLERLINENEMLKGEIKNMKAEYNCERKLLNIGLFLKKLKGHSH